MDKYCNNTWQWVVQALGSNKDSGLKEIEIEERRDFYGSNQIKLNIGKNIFYYMLKESLRIYIVFSLILVWILYINNYLFYGMSLIGTTFLTILLKSYIKYEGQKRISYLQGLNYTNVRVIRDGVDKVIRADELVVGDIVYFSKNSLIPADLRIITLRNLKVDEKTLTGENFLKEKLGFKIQGNIRSLGDMKNILLRGSIIKNGEGAGVVVATGNRTQLGKMLAPLNYWNEKSYIKDFERKLSLGVFTLSIISIVLYLMFYSKETVENRLILSLFSIYIMPMTLVLIGYIAALKKNISSHISIINPSALQSINEIEIMFMDKVGSFTKEEMEVVGLVTNFEKIELNEVNYNKDINIKRLIDILLICNNSTYNVNENSGKGSIEEIAYLKFAAIKGAYKSIVDNRNKRKLEISMDSDKRVLTVITKAKRGVRANLRGNVDEILDRCKYIMVDGLEKEMTLEDRERIRAIDYNLSIEGLTTEGVAYRSFSYEPSESENIESNLVFVGIVALNNPLVDDYAGKIQTLRENNIIPIIFTSSNKIAATAFGIRAGLIRNSSEVISGVELEALSNDELVDILRRVRIFSRVSIESKIKIIDLFAKDNYKILSTGENIGDLPSLSLSTVGVTTGNAAKAVKSSSDIYIEKDFLSNIFKVIRIGKDFKDSKENFLNIFYMISLIQIVLINTYKIYVEREIRYTYVILMCITLGLPILIMSLNNGFSKLKLKGVITSVATICMTVLFSSYLFGEEGYELSLVVLVMCLTIWTFINEKASREKCKSNLIINIVLGALLLGLIYIVLTSFSVSFIDGISIGIIISIFTMIEWIIKKWILL